MKTLRALMTLACLVALALPAQATTQTHLEAARQAVAQHPDSPEAHFELAMAFARTAYLEQGWESLKRIQELDPGFASKVVERYEARVVEAPQDPEARFRLAFGYYFLDKKDQALGQIEQLIALRPQDPWGYNYKGFLLAEQNRIDEAYQQWQRALTLDQDNAVTHYLIGQVHYRQGRFLQATKAIAQALRLRATSPLKP